MADKYRLLKVLLFREINRSPFIFKHIRSAPHAKVLDIGSWNSIVPIQLAMLGYYVTGIDIQEYGYTNPNFTFIQADFNRYNFKGKEFDIVTNISAIEHFGLLCYETKERDSDADKKALSKIRELLKSKGQLLFTAPFGLHGEVENFERIYDMKDIRTLLKGFKIFSIETYLVNRHHVGKIRVEDAEKIQHNEKEHNYAVICIDAEKMS